MLSLCWCYICFAISIHPYLNYSILNWRRASNATVQPLIKLQNKSIKIIKPTNTKSLEEPFQHLNILSLPKIYALSVGKFMHSCRNKLLSNRFDEYFLPISSIHFHSTRLATSNNLFLPGVNSSSVKCSLTKQMHFLSHECINEFFSAKHDCATGSQPA